MRVPWHSRYSLSRVVVRADGVSYLSDEIPYPYEDLPDNQPHVVIAGDTLPAIADQYWSGLNDPPAFYAAMLWWVIADFQPQPILDPRRVLEPGTLLIIPSAATVESRVLNRAVRDRRGIA